MRLIRPIGEILRNTFLAGLATIILLSVLYATLVYLNNTVIAMYKILLDFPSDVHLNLTSINYTEILQEQLNVLSRQEYALVSINITTGLLLSAVREHTTLLQSITSKLDQLNSTLTNIDTLVDLNYEINEQLLNSTLHDNVLLENLEYLVEGNQVFLQGILNETVENGIYITALGGTVSDINDTVSGMGQTQHQIAEKVGEIKENQEEFQTSFADFTIAFDDSVVEANAFYAAFGAYAGEFTEFVATTEPVFAFITGTLASVVGDYFNPIFKLGGWHVRGISKTVDAHIVNSHIIVRTEDSHPLQTQFQQPVSVTLSDTIFPEVLGVYITNETLSTNLQYPLPLPVHIEKQVLQAEVVNNVSVMVQSPNPLPVSFEVAGPLQAEIVNVPSILISGPDPLPVSLQNLPSPVPVNVQNALHLHPDTSVYISNDSLAVDCCDNTTPEPTEPTTEPPTEPPVTSVCLQPIGQIIYQIDMPIQDVPKMFTFEFAHESATQGAYQVVDFVIADEPNRYVRVRVNQQQKITTLSEENFNPADGQVILACRVRAMCNANSLSFGDQYMCLENSAEFDPHDYKFLIIETPTTSETLWQTFFVTYDAYTPGEVAASFTINAGRYITVHYNYVEPNVGETVMIRAADQFAPVGVAEINPENQGDTCIAVGSFTGALPQSIIKPLTFETTHQAGEAIMKLYAKDRAGNVAYINITQHGDITQEGEVNPQEGEVVGFFLPGEW